MTKMKYISFYYCVSCFFLVILLSHLSFFLLSETGRDSSYIFNGFLVAVLLENNVFLIPDFLYLIQCYKEIYDSNATFYVPELIICTHF